ncbi:MAG: hypothetical protein RBR63_10570, partial [Methanosarcina vacuolata]|nr:hypothetical protein [Methanosarcina vacuolata]
RKGLKTLEPYEGKLSSTVPRGERRSNPPDLPNNTSCFHIGNCFIISLPQIIIKYNFHVFLEGST